LLVICLEVSSQVYPFEDVAFPICVFLFFAFVEPQNLSPEVEYANK